MKDKNIKIGIEEIKKITMTDSEKERIYRNILNHTKAPVRSHWSFTFSLFTQNSRMVYAFIIPLIIILSGTGAAFASTDSLPDSILYPIKVNVLEPIEGALNVSLKSKAKHESKLAEKRLAEAETLASMGKLDKTNEEKINKLLSKHTEDLSDVLGKAKSLNDDEEIDSITTDFRAQMNAHAKVLQVLTSKKNKTDKEDSSETKISNTARLGAEKIKNSSDNNDEGKIKKIKERRYKVENIVESTDSDLNMSGGEENDLKNDSKKKIDQAKAYLYEAEQKSLEGKQEEAYSSLLDSESSAKEAKILLKTRIKMEHSKEDNDSED
jgi:hypothetical protein